MSDNSNGDNTNKSTDNKSGTNEIMSRVFGVAQRLLDTLKDGERTTLSDLTDKVVAETKYKLSIVQGLIALFLDDWSAKGFGEVLPGRKNGIFKGKKPVRQDKRPRCEACGQVYRGKGLKEVVEHEVAHRTEL